MAASSRGRRCFGLPFARCLFQDGVETGCEEPLAPFLVVLRTEAQQLSGAEVAFLGPPGLGRDSCGVFGEVVEFAHHVPGPYRSPGCAEAVPGGAVFGQGCRGGVGNSGGVDEEPRPERTAGKQ